MRKALMMVAVLLAAFMLGGCPAVPPGGSTPATAGVSGGELTLSDAAGNSANVSVIVNALGGTIHSGVPVSGCTAAAAYPGYAYNYTCAGVIDKVTVWANDGDDTVEATGGTKVEVHGGDGRDTITVTFTSATGNSTVYGDGGNDSIVLKQNAGQVYGGAGDDTITTGPGVDDVHAGPGADTVTAQFGGDTIFGDDDGDTLRVGNVAGGSCAPSNGVPVLHGGAGDDSLTGLDMPDTLYGDAGDDVMHGGGCGDSLNGGDGNDWLYGDPGADSFLGNLGFDYVFAKDGAIDHTINCGGPGVDGASLQDYDPDDASILTNC